MPESCLGSKGMLEKFYFSKKFLFVFLLMLRLSILLRFKSNAREIFYKILFVFLLMPESCLGSKVMLENMSYLK